MNPEYGVLLVGGDRTHQEAHALSFAADPRCHLVAVTDVAGISEERKALCQSLAEAHGIPFIAGLEEALAMPGLLIVSLCSAVEDRADVAETCARSGYAIFLDKPLAGSLAGGRRIRDAIRNADLPSQMYSFTGLPWAVAAKECVDSGRIGDLRAVHAETMFAKGPGGVPPPRVDRVETPQPDRYTFTEAKREFFDLGVYPIGLCLWLTGKRAIDVTTVTGNYFFGEHARVDVEDFGACVMRLEGDITATAVAGRIGYYSHPKGGPNRVTLVGTRGTETFDAWTPRIEVYNAEPSPVLLPPNPNDPMMMWRSTAVAGGNPPKRGWDVLANETNWYPLDIKRFVDCLETGARPDITVEEASLSLEVLMAAYQSAASNSTVAVERL